MLATFSTYVLLESTQRFLWICFEAEVAADVGGSAVVELSCSCVSCTADPELNLCSMESLLKVAPLLKISSNDIFVVTIKNVASKLQQLGSAAASPQMVQSLEEIFERITDPHLAMVCGQWLKHLLKGMQCVSWSLVSYSK